MEPRYRDEDLIAAMPFARGFDRELLICALGYSSGKVGVPELKRLYEAEKGNNRTSALISLALRLGSGSTPACVEALHSTSGQLQELGAMLLAEFGDSSASAEMLAWFDRRVGRKTRSRTWSPFELPSGIMFAARHGQQGEVAAVIARHWSNLDDDEQAWLRRTWPGLFTNVGTLAQDPRSVPAPTELQFDIYQDDRPLSAGLGSGPIEIWGYERVDGALARAQRRGGVAGVND